MSKQAILIFARSNSKRLPGKVLKEIYLGKNLLEIIILRLKKFLRIKIIVCTSKSKADNKIVKICKKNKIKYFRGELSNVFKRTKDCLKKYKLKSFIRINADRPFVDFDEIQKIIRIYKKKKFDIITNNLDRNCPKGLTCELAQSKIFFDINEKNLSKVEKEHIFDYFYRNQKDYKIYNFEQIKKNFKKSLALDNKYDLNNVRNLFKKFKFDYLISTQKVIEFLRRN